MLAVVASVFVPACLCTNALDRLGGTSLIVTTYTAAIFGVVWLGVALSERRSASRNRP